MKNILQFIVAALGIGVAVLLLTGCHHFGGSGCCARSSAPPVNAATSSAPAQPNAPSGHQH